MTQHRPRPACGLTVVAAAKGAGARRSRAASWARAFELTLTRSDEDWNGSRVSMDLEPTKDGTHVRFAYQAWPDANDHYHASSYCWAMYLRLMKRHLETGEQVPYGIRLDV
jgi:hypothetical protein